MLNDQDRMKFLMLQHVAKEERRDLVHEDVLWLLEKLRPAFYSRPDEFEFPERAALINRIACNAFEMLQAGKPDWKREQELPEGILSYEVEVFGINLSCPPTNAFLIVRPWIRAHLETSDQAFEQLRSCSLTLLVDGKEFLSKAPIADYLITMDGVGIRSLSPVLRCPGECGKVFPACGLEIIHSKNPYRSFVSQEGGNIAVPEKNFGIFCTGNCPISMTIQGPSGIKNEAMKVVSGLTVMEYTTKGTSSIVPLRS